MSLALDWYKDRCSKLEKELQRYKDLEEQGRLIELPCAFGDKVYSVYKGYDIHGNKTFHIENEAFRVYMLDGFGKHVFLTKEEAEAKLKELEGVKE